MKKQTKITWALMGVVALSACGGLEKSRSLGPAADGGDAVTSEDAGNNYSKIGDGPIQPDVAIKSPDSRDNSEADAPVSVDGPPRNDGSQSPDAPTCTTPASCCKGCWDGTKCQTGSDVSACGVGGASCKVCNDGNPCTADKCTAGACEADKLTGATCPTASAPAVFATAEPPASRAARRGPPARAIRPASRIAAVAAAPKALRAVRATSAPRATAAPPVALARRVAARASPAAETTSATLASLVEAVVALLAAGPVSRAVPRATRVRPT